MATLARRQLRLTLLIIGLALQTDRRRYGRFDGFDGDRHFRPVIKRNSTRTILAARSMTYRRGRFATLDIIGPMKGSWPPPTGASRIFLSMQR